MSSLRISLFASACIGWLLVIPSVHAADPQGLVIKKHKAIGPYIQDSGPKNRSLYMDQTQSVISQRERASRMMKNMQKSSDDAKRQMMKNCPDCFR